MSRFKLILLSLFAVLTVSAVASASASAVCSVKGEGVDLSSGTLCVEGVELDGSGSIKFTSTSGASNLKAGGTLVKCTASTDTGEFEDRGGDSLGFNVSDVTITFTGCTVPTPKNCAVKNKEIVANGGGDSIDGTAKSATKEIEFLPSEKTVFATINIISEPGTCNIAGAKEVKTKNGKGPECSTDSNIETEEAIHKITCEPAKSNLEFLNEAAEFEIKDEVLVEGRKKWAITKE